MIRLTGVSRTFAGRSGTVEALRGIDLEIGEGEFVAVLGRSGCGKSTLLRLISGLLPVTAGEVRVSGERVTKPRRDIAMMFQKPALGHASAVQVTTFGCFAGTVACLPFAGQLVSQLGSAPVSDTLNVVYLGLFPTMLGFTTWAYALARTPSGKMGATTYAVPGLVVLMSWLILGQVPRWLTIAGGALCLAGVAVSRSRSARKATPAAPVAVAAENQPR